MTQEVENGPSRGTAGTIFVQAQLNWWRNDTQIYESDTDLLQALLSSGATGTRMERAASKFAQGGPSHCCRTSSYCIQT